MFILLNICKNIMTGDVDFAAITAIQQKRTLAFVNHFLLTTVQFMNNFANKCEEKLMRFERKLEKVEAAMVVLETRLSSVPEVNTINKTSLSEASKIQTAHAITDNNISKQDDIIIKQDEMPLFPEYDKFVKMVQVGVPLAAVKLKVSTEGLDPDILVQILGK